MGYSLMDKIKRFVCKTIGHKPFETWFFNGFAYHSCKRCKEVYRDISVPLATKTRDPKPTKFWHRS